MGKGWQGAILKALRAQEFQFTVTAVTDVGAHYRRISFTDGGLLSEIDWYPGMWVRMWFPPRGGGAFQQRGYTILAPSTPGTIDIEFALHDGLASDWARSAKTGDTVEATLMGSGPELPEKPPAAYVLVGDSSALAAIASILHQPELPPAHVFLEYQHDDEKSLPVPGNPASVQWVPRTAGGQRLIDTVTAFALPAGSFGWVTAEAAPTRAITKHFKSSGLAKDSIHSQAYWLDRSKGD